MLCSCTGTWFQQGSGILTNWHLGSFQLWKNLCFFVFSFGVSGFVAGKLKHERQLRDKDSKVQSGAQSSGMVWHLLSSSGVIRHPTRNVVVIVAAAAVVAALVVPENPDDSRLPDKLQHYVKCIDTYRKHAASPADHITVCDICASLFATGSFAAVCHISQSQALSQRSVTALNHRLCRSCLSRLSFCQ